MPAHEPGRAAALERFAHEARAQRVEEVRRRSGDPARAQDAERLGQPGERDAELRAAAQREERQGRAGEVRERQRPRGMGCRDGDGARAGQQDGAKHRRAAGDRPGDPHPVVPDPEGGAAMPQQRGRRPS